MTKVIILILLSLLGTLYPALSMSQTENLDPDYWTIEGMRSQEFSIGIFIFMIIGVGVFLVIVFQMATTLKVNERLKTGEKVMLVCIILGVIFAVSFGAMQLLQGRLF